MPSCEDCKEISGEILKIYNIMRLFDSNIDLVFKCLGNAKTKGEVMNCTSKIFYRYSIFKECWGNDIVPSLNRIKAICPQFGEYLHKRLVSSITSVRRIINRIESRGHAVDEDWQEIEYPASMMEDIL